MSKSLMKGYQTLKSAHFDTESSQVWQFKNRSSQPNDVENSLNMSQSVPSIKINHRKHILELYKQRDDCAQMRARALRERPQEIFCAGAQNSRACADARKLKHLRIQNELHQNFLFASILHTHFKSSLLQIFLQ